MKLFFICKLRSNNGTVPEVILMATGVGRNGTKSEAVEDGVDKVI